MTSTASSTTVKPYSIMMLEPDAHIAASLSSYFKQFYRGDLALNGHLVNAVGKAKLQLDEQPYDLVLLDVNLADELSTDFVAYIQSNFPRTKIATWTQNSLEGSIKLLKDKKISNVIVKEVPFDFSEFSREIENILEPRRAFGLERYLSPFASIQRTELTNSHQIADMFMTLQGFLAENEVTFLNEMLTAFIEAVTNAVYHAPILASGKPKYRKGQVIDALAPEEIVSIQYGHDERYLGISVKDQWGRLNPEQLLFWLERNMSGENLLDVSGRGMFLMHTLCDRLIVNIEKNKRTEFVLLTRLQSVEQVNKPLYIHQYG